MTKILFPLLLLAGLALGLYVLLGRRGVIDTSGATGLRLVILATAASVVGALGACGADAKKKPKPPPMITCYEPVEPAPLPLSEDEEDALARIRQKIDLLESLLKQGKLTDQAFMDALAKMKKDIAILEANEMTGIEELHGVEMDLVGVRRDLEEKHLASMKTLEAWTSLKKQYGELHLYLDGKKNAYDAGAVKKALGKLQEKKLITASTGSALEAAFTQVVLHYDRSHAGKTCYDMTMLGANIQTWRGALTSLIRDIRGETLDDDAFQSRLYTLAPALACVQIQKDDACDTSSQTDAYTRATVIETLAILEALGL